MIFDIIFLFIVEVVKDKFEIVKIFVIFVGVDDMLDNLFGVIVFDDWIVGKFFSVSWGDFLEEIVCGFCYMFGIMGNLKGVFYLYCLNVLYMLIIMLKDVMGMGVNDVVLFVVLMFYVNVWGFVFGCLVMGVNMVMFGV